MRLLMVYQLVICIYTQAIFSQPVTQTLKGSVFDVASGHPLAGATVVISGTNPLQGTITDIDGNFRINSVPVGRYNIRISFVGYQTYIAKEIIIGSGKEVVLNIGLKEKISDLEQVTINAYSKSETINAMATVSGKQVSVEEANRYAGGFDDPARLVSSYAGVTYSVGNNGIVIRGNSPKGLLWRMEGVQIPNPNHFADYISLGGGAVTAISSQTMANSDFFTGAFPAEYGNALSGVFDINMRKGNADKREHAFQVSVIGIDFTSEGPFKKGNRASYLFNYRYSTLGLVSPILPEEMGKLSYQDLSFKLSFPVKSGTFSLWGIGACDYQGKKAENDSTKWENTSNRKEYITKLSMGATGLSFKKIISTKTFIQATMALTENSIDWSQKRYSDSLQLQPKRSLSDYRWKYTLTGFVNKKFNAKHANKTGFILNHLVYDIDIKNAETYGDPLISYVSERSAANLFQFYSQSKINLSDHLAINAGFHSLYFTLNSNYTLEPRVGIHWKFNPLQTISIAYGLHSQLEMIQLYLLEQNTSDGKIMPNKNLDFNKAHHFVLRYEIQLDEDLHLKAEPYYQILHDIPVVPDSYISTINLNEVWDFNDSLINEGSGKNIGIDVTLERYLNKGYYYLFTLSLFDSKYKGGDGKMRNTKYNKNYVINILGGKEWKTGRDQRNLFSANLRFTFMGGDRTVPLDIDETIKQEMIVEDYSRAWEKKLKDAPILCASIVYMVNKLHHASIWSFQIINALGHKDFQEYEYNVKEKRIDQIEDMLIIPNISYKVEF